MKPTCSATNCPRRRRYHGLCECHGQRWVLCGRPNKADWLKAGAPTPTRWRGQVRTTLGIPFGRKVTQ